jgi:hypothetical protein
MVARSAFEGCSGLTHLKIPSRVTMIADSTFADCSGLTMLEIPSTVSTIGLCAFRGCSSLTRLDIPASVTTIGESAFAGCSCLEELRFPSNLVGLEGKGVFNGVTKLERLTLVGSVLSPAVVVALEGCLTSTAEVIGPALVERKFGRFTFGGGRWGRFTPGCLDP